MGRIFLTTFLVLSFSVLFVFADDDKAKVSSLDDAKTVADIVDYVAKSTAVIDKSPTKSVDDFIKKSYTIGELSIKGGDKILKITDDKSEQDQGFKLKVTGLKRLIAADRYRLDRVRLQRSGELSADINADNQDKLDTLIDKLESEGRLPIVTNGERYRQFTVNANKLRNKFSQNEFDVFVKGAKEWSVKNPVDFAPVAPLLKVAEIAAAVEVKNDLQILDKTIKDLTDFVDSDEFVLPEADKKTIHGQLAKHATLVLNNELYAKFAKEADSLQNNFDAGKFDHLVSEAKKLAANSKGAKLAQPLLKILEVTVASAEQRDVPIVDDVLKDFTDFINSNNLNLDAKNKAEIIDQLTGYLSRIVDAKPEIYGKTLEDKDFVWTDLRGKYVLVKFTASWCGPCKREIPGMLSAYEKYRDKGLEIVSIYVWDKLDATKKIVDEEKISWIVLSEELTQKSGLPLQGKKFAITGVPTMFLVNGDGEIILTEARGGKLQKKLEELFPEDNTAQAKR